MSELPRALGDYQIASVLGEGGSGTVYLARRDGVEVALKVLRRDQTASDRQRRRWLEEAEHLGRIGHPAVVRVFDAGVLEDGRPYLAMERLQGVTLAERVSGGALDVDLALRLFDQLASAVQAIHAAGLIHRDLKPENIMLVAGGTRVVVLDLGIARAADAPPSTTTRVGYQRGTPAVMAPERFFGERATIRSDLYELGVVLFVMLTGSLPWRAILDAQARLNPLRPGELGVTLPPAMEQALMRALASDAADRPATVAELAAEIRSGGWSGPTLPAGAVVDPRAVTTGPTGHASDGREAASPGQLDSRTEATGGRRLRWAVRIALLAGLGLIAAPVAIALLDPGSEPKPAEAEPAPVLALPEAVIVPAAPPPDAAPVVSPDAAIARADRTAPPPRSPPKPRTRAPAADAGVAPPVAAGAMPWCRKQAALYCTDEFRATEGALAGKLCETMTAQVSKWEALPAEARASLERSCEQGYPQLAAAAAERIRFHRERGTPPAP